MNCQIIGTQSALSLLNGAAALKTAQYCPSLDADCYSPLQNQTPDLTLGEDLRREIRRLGCWRVPVLMEREGREKKRQTDRDKRLKITNSCRHATHLLFDQLSAKNRHFCDRGN